LLNSNARGINIVNFQVEYMAHGQDPSYDENGNDVYEFVKSVGRFKTIRRTEGVSTSELILRIIKEYDGIVCFCA
jgi:choline-phosphate cytidylyltransferase